MAESQYNSVTWSEDDLITPEKLQKMASNTDFVFTRQVYAAYWGAVFKNTGVRMISGVITLHGAGERQVSGSINFANTFSPGCKPIVTTGTVCENRNVVVTFHGLTGQLMPDERGFTVHAKCIHRDPAQDIIGGKVHVTWTAVGY